MNINEMNFFLPSFGNYPETLIGRDEIIDSFKQSLYEPIGSRSRSALYLGQRGMGKTALLLKFESIAKENNFVTARVTEHEDFTKDIIDRLQINGSKYFSNNDKITGITAGVFGFSIGLSFNNATENQLGFNSKLSLICDKLAEKNKGVLILIDEVSPSKEMREVATAFQELVGDHKNIIIIMAGLPHAVSSVYNDKTLTFLNRASKVELGPISTEDILSYFIYAFDKLNIKYSEKVLNLSAEEAKGNPYLMQLLGYYLVKYSSSTKTITDTVFNLAKTSALKDYEQNIYQPILKPLSDNDIAFLHSMSLLEQPVKINKLREVLADKANSISVYRKRMMDAGIIDSPRYGELVFTVPHIREYLKSKL